MSVTTTAPAGADLEPHRRELTGYCYRMLGCAADAQDAVQETFLRAWQGGFKGQSSLRTWLFRIATTVCLDALRARARRARPMDLGPASAPVAASLEAVGEDWVLPAPTALVLPTPEDPAAVVEARDTVRLAFLAALQHLPPRQRAVLVLCEVLRWQAAEVADLLETSVASVTSALQRARAALAAAPLHEPPDPLPAELAGLLGRYVAAFEAYDVNALVALLREDAVLNMPPYAMWLRGRDDIAAWLLGPGEGCRGSRLVPVSANGATAFAQYRLDPAGGWSAFSLNAIETEGDQITCMTSFLGVQTLFPLFGLPMRLAWDTTASGAEPDSSTGQGRVGRQ